MSARNNVCLSARSLLFHARRDTSCKTWSQGSALRAQHRAFSDKPIADRPFENQSDGEAKGPTMDPLPHISEEAAATKKSMGEQGPEIEQQGSPASEVIKGDKEAQENLPKVMKEQIQKRQSSAGVNKGTQGKKGFSTLAKQNREHTSPFLLSQLDSSPVNGRPFSTDSRRLADLQHVPNDEANMQVLQDLMAEGLRKDANTPKLSPGLKFEAPSREGGNVLHLQKRYEPIVDQVTKLLMSDGKLSVAQKQMNLILTHLRTSPAPRPSDNAPLVPGTPPLTELPLNPITYLTVAIDSIAPLFKIRNLKGLVGGGAALPIPVPLTMRQRRRTAIVWILDQVEKRKGGVSPFGKRFAEEVVSIVEGRSSLWERRTALHSQGTRARANLVTASKARGQRIR